MYNIGEAAALANLPVSTLRYYDKSGLFPNLKREGGVRKFGQLELEQLKLIACLKKSGLGIKAIRQFMSWTLEGEATYGRRLELLRRQLAAVDDERRRLEATRDLIIFKCWYYERAAADGSERELQAMIAARALPADIQALYDRTLGELRVNS